jgi:hypothetical protein
MPVNPSQLTPQERLIYDSLNSTQKNIYLDLSDEVRRIVGRWAPQNACPSDQRIAGVCQPDPRVTSQVGVRKPTDWDLMPPDSKFSDRIYRYRIKDARKGDLLLTPGGPSGLIGAMLNALRPPQDYSHMGIVVEDDGSDAIALRHCTASEDWLSRKLFTTGTIFEGLPLEHWIPLHGFRSDAVKYIWPGTITQTVEAAYKSHRDVQYRDEVYELDNQGNYLWQNDEYGKRQRILRDKYAVLDPVREGDDRGTGGRYRIAALTFDPVWVPPTGDTPGHWADPLIVQPCRSKRTPAVSMALDRIADACKQLRGHYRLFAYTNGQVGELSDGPVTLEGLCEPHCRDGQYVADPVATTRGMVCSTFIWQAVQLANLPQGGTTYQRILLDGRPLRPEPESTRDDRCAELTTQWGRRRGTRSDQSPANPIDGFYFYSAANRTGAGEALQRKIVEKVMEHLAEFLDKIAGPPLLGALEGAYVGSTISQLLAWNPLYLAVLLGVSKAHLDGEVQKLRDTATHVSNQWGDTFRKDNAAQDNESDDWKYNPGSGNTVSPDDILNSWSAPHYGDEDEVVGVYGSNIRAEVLSPAPIEGEWRPSTWEIATDRTSLGARVFHRDANGNPVYLGDALVRVGCAELITRAQANMAAPQPVPNVPTGRYFARAVWTDPATSFQWRSPRRIVTVPGPDQDIEIFPPKQSRRQIRIHGEAELLNRHATDEIPVIGTDPWERTVGFDSGWILMGMDFSNVNPADDPEFFAWLQQNRGADLEGLQERSWPLEFQMEDWGIVRVVFNCKLDPSGGITLTVKGGTRDGTDQTDNTEPDWGEEETLPPIPPKLSNTEAGFPFDFRVERTGFAVPPARATLHVKVDNNQQPG